MSLDKGKSSKVLSKSFMENNKNVDLDTARELLVEATLKIREIKEEQAADVNVQAAKAVLKDLNGAYSAAKKYEKAKIDFLLDRINELNEQLNNKE